jgi:hypothetical protein
MSTRTRVVLLIVSCVGVLCVFSCCGGLVYLGLDVATEEVRASLEQDDRFAEHVGQIEDFSLDFIGSVADDDDDTWIYNVKGSRWSGRITVKHVTDNDGDERIVWVRFVLPSGEKVELQEPFP